MRIIFLIIALILSVCTKSHAQFKLNFYEISLKEGLSQTSVHDICRDYKGILWIGTSFGLNRYDGSQMRQYFNAGNDTTSISGNQIHFIKEDQSKNLWIGTNQSVVRYNRESDNFERPNELKNIIIKSCYQLEDRIIFFTTDRMISYFFQDGSFRTTFFQANIRNIPLSIKIAQLDKQTLLLGTRWRGIFRCDIKTGQLFQEKFHPSAQITDLCIDDNEVIWLSSYGEGLFAYNRNGKLLNHFTTENSDLCYNVILDLQITNNGDLWIATDGNGISRLDKKYTFHNLIYSPENPNSLPVNSVSKIYQDEYDNIWIGSVRGGVIGTKSNFIRSYTHSFQNSEHGTSERTISSFYEDNNGDIWIGTDGNGINLFNPRNEKFRHYPSTFRRKVTSIAKYSDNELLLSYFHGRLKLFNIKNGTTREFPVPVDNTDSNNGWIGTTLKNMDKDNILIMGENLHIYSISKNRMNCISNWSKDSLDGGLKFINYKDSVLHIHSPSKIYRINLKNETISLLANTKRSIRTEITAVTQDSTGCFWIGADKGLWKFDPTNEKFTIQNNSIFKRVSTLCFSNDSLLWVGASNMLYCYHIDKKQIWEFGSSDGVQPNIYISKATFRAQNGDIYFGGVNGFQRIMVQSRQKDSVNPVIEPIELQLNGSLFTGFAPDTDRKVTIPPTNQTIDLRLIVKDQSFFNKKIIRYKLEGINDNYIITNDPTIRFTNLSPGEYVLKAQIRNGEGGWSRAFDIIHLTVSPFWWQTWWFKLIIFGSFIILLYWGWAFYHKKQAKMVSDKLAEHEKEMAEQKIRFLININHELRTPLTLISAPVERLLKDRKLIHDESQKTLLGIYKQTKHMRNVIDMVLDIRKMELSHNELHLSSFNFNQFMEEIIEDFRLEYNAKEIDLEYSSDLDADSLVRLDKDKCHKIITNLMANALKFSDSNSKVCIKIEKKQERIIIYVIDEGIGLAGIDTDKLFKRFYQANHNRGGSGIGLSYSKNLAELMGGTIDCRANKERGATFRVELPESAAPFVAKDIIVTESITAEKEYDVCTYDSTDKDYTMLKDYTILIVEDQPELNSYLKSELSSYFKNVYTAYNGKEGLDIALDKMPDCIISDIMMPEMNGYELCNHLKSNIEVSHIPLILLTARTDEASTRYGYKSGADAYLTKPFSLEALLSLTTNMFSLRVKLQERFRSSGYTLLPEEICCNNEEEQFLKKLMAVIEEEISNPDLDVDMLADRMAVSRSTLYSKMKSISGSGVKDFINEIRIKRAMILLQETNMQIVEISEKVGYNQQRYFSTVFKQYTQMTPTQYRSENNAKSKENT